MRRNAKGHVTRYTETEDLRCDQADLVGEGVIPAGPHTYPVTLYIPDDAVGGTGASNEMLAGLEALRWDGRSLVPLLRGSGTRAWSQQTVSELVEYAPGGRKGGEYSILKVCLGSEQFYSGNTVHTFRVRNR